MLKGVPEWENHMEIIAEFIGCTIGDIVLEYFFQRIFLYLSY